KTGVAYLPFTAALFLGAGAVTQLVPKIGARPVLLAGSAAAAGGLYWLSRISEHDTYTSAVLGPTMVIGAGTALLFVTLSLVALNRVPEADSGVASSLLNTGQQAGGSVGLALLGTVAWTVVAHSIHAQAATAARAGHPPRPAGPLAAAIYTPPRAPGSPRPLPGARGVRLPPPAHHPRRDPDPPRRPRRRPAAGDRAARTEAMTVKQIRIQRPRARRDRDWLEVLPPDP